MGAMKSLAEDLELTGDEPEIVYETIIDTEIALRQWATYLSDSGRIYQ